MRSTKTAISNDTVARVLQAGICIAFLGVKFADGLDPSGFTLLVDGEEVCRGQPPFAFDTGAFDPGAHTLTVRCNTFPDLEDTADLDIVKVDLNVDSNYDGAIDDSDEDSKTTAGGLVPVNQDDDNMNGTPDKDDGYTGGENDLVPVKLKVIPSALASGTVTLSVSSFYGRIRLWTDACKTEEVVLPKVWSPGSETLPGTLYAEGIEASGAARDVELTLRYDEGAVACEDSVRLTVVKVKSIELVSGATAAHVAPLHTWAAVKNANNPTEYILLRAEMEPDIDSVSLPAGIIAWSGGEAVANNRFQRRVAKDKAAYTELVASCGGSSATGHVWVLWSDITVRHVGEKTKYNSETDTGFDKDFPDYCYGTRLGAENRLFDFPKYLGWKVEIKADITPSGAHDVITSGLDFFQSYTAVDFQEDTNTPIVSVNQVDTVFNAGDFQDQTLDPNNEIFALDGPGVFSKEVDFNHFKSTCNFKVWVRWNGERISDDATWWIRQKADRQGTNYAVFVNSGGAGITTLEYSY